MCLINPTSVSAQAVELRGLEADLVVTPETKLTAAGQKVAEAALGHQDEDGWKAVFGKPQPRKKRKGRETTEWDAKQGGIAMFAHRPAPIQEMREQLLDEFMEQDEPHLWEEGRLVHGQLGVGSGATTVHVLG